MRFEAGLRAKRVQCFALAIAIDANGCIRVTLTRVEIQALSHKSAR